MHSFGDMLFNALRRNSITILATCAVLFAVITSVSVIKTPSSEALSANETDTSVTLDKDISILFEGRQERHDLPYSFDLSKEREITVFLDISDIDNIQKKTLDLTSGYASVNIYRNDTNEELFSYVPKAHGAFSSEGYLMHYVSLENIRTPKPDTLKIVYHLPPGSNSSHRIEPFYIGDHSTLIKQNFLREIPQLIMVLTMFIVFFMLIMINIILFFKNPSGIKLLHLSYMAFLVGTYILFQTRSIRYYQPLALFYHVFEYYNLAMMPIPVMFITQASADTRFHKVFNAVLVLLSANLVFQSAMLLAGVFEPRDLLFVTHIVMFITVIVTITAYLLTNSKKFPQKTILTYSVMPLVFAFLGGLISYVFFASKIYNTFLMLGTLMFIVLQLVFIIKKYYEIANKMLLESTYKKFAMEDYLTGVGSRLAYGEKLDWIENNLPQIKELLILTFDLNGLKKVNDTFGHVEGDHMLQFFAQCLAKLTAKHKGNVYRLGGDEFSALLINVAEPAGEDIIHKMRNLVHTYPNKNVHVDFAVGMEHVQGSKDIDLNARLIRADQKMYEDKARIKARVIQ